MPTTTVLTTTLTALAADRPDLGRPGSHTARRAAVVVAMLVGAAAGAVIVLQAAIEWAIATAVVLLATVAVAARHRGGRPAR